MTAVVLPCPDCGLHSHPDAETCFACGRPLDNVGLAVARPDGRLRRPIPGDIVIVDGTRCFLWEHGDGNGYEVERGRGGWRDEVDSVVVTGRVVENGWVRVRLTRPGTPALAGRWKVG